MDFDYDYLIVGSGFGGSVSALRLAEKGWRVGVVEQGRRVGQDEIRRGKNSLHRLLWNPGLGMKGYFAQRVFRHLMVVGGVGVGGGSLVWGAVMLEPKQDFYRDPRLQSLGVDWEGELGPCFERAREMLGVGLNPRHTAQDDYLQQTAKGLGVPNSFGPVPNAIYFGRPDEAEGDSGEEGNGQNREACTFCGGCLTGCEIGAKNSLDFNYLYQAEKLGVAVLPERKADRIESLQQGGYRVHLVSPGLGRKIQAVTARKVVVASGVLGTLELLFRNRDAYKTLANVSSTLGEVVRTNSEAITAVLHPAGEDMTDGTAISSDFHPDAHTHVTQNRFDRGYRFMRYLMGPMVDEVRPIRRALKTLVSILGSPLLMARNLFMRDWEKRITVFTVMQDHDNSVRLSYRRRWWSLFRRRLVSQSNPGHELPSYMPIANRSTREYARVSGGTPMSTLTESMAGMCTTAHILSGCPMGSSADHSVISTEHEVHGHPGLFVVDGASIPANIGVNPSLTISAMAERFAASQPGPIDA
ncbi:MAG: GMC family oxidoreductase [Halioglobus sp.]